MTITERLNEVYAYLLAHSKVSSQADLARRLGKSRGQVSSMLSGTANTTMKTAGILCDAYPEINRAWLLTGEGTMLNAAPSPITQTNSVTISNVGNHTGSELSKEDSAELAALKAENAALKAENARLREEVEWLRSLIQK